jgi:hypothetical protein
MLRILVAVVLGCAAAIIVQAEPEDMMPGSTKSRRMYVSQLNNIA